MTGSQSSATMILAVATALAEAPGLSAHRATVIATAASAIGVPYRWGGNGPDGFDCSGLVVAAFRSVSVVLPRTAQSQYDATHSIETGPTPGDLVFFGPSHRDVSHVGIVLGRGLMIDAPHTGAFVRIESYAWPNLLDYRELTPFA